MFNLQECWGVLGVESKVVNDLTKCLGSFCNINNSMVK